MRTGKSAAKTEAIVYQFFALAKFNCVILEKDLEKNIIPHRGRTSKRKDYIASSTNFRVLFARADVMNINFIEGALMFQMRSIKDSDIWYHFQYLLF